MTNKQQKPTEPTPPRPEKVFAPIDPAWTAHIEDIRATGHKTESGGIINFVPMPMTSEREAAGRRFWTAVAAMANENDKDPKEPQQ